jgi:DNA replication and repair protein RecF
MLQTLRALDFRCWGSFSINVPAGGGIFVGNNAQGKTSILEAVCVLLRLQSPRTHKLSSLTRFHTAGFGIAAEIDQCQRKIRFLHGSLVCEVDGERRPSSQEYLRDSGLVVWMGNDDLDLLRGSGETRRRYLDFLGSQWDACYRTHWSRYRRALKMKNSLLKAPSPDEKQIVAWEEIMIESGTIIGQVRQKMLSALTPMVAAHHSAIGIGSEIVTVAYLRSGAEDLRTALRHAHERERRTRQSVIGPHRDDITLQINGLSAAEYASEGQQRTLVLALKLAQGSLLTSHRGLSPIYLIDDVFGELDPARRNALMLALPASAQKWITTTHLDWLHESETYTALPQFAVAEGRIG